MAYEWARASVPKGWHVVGDLAEAFRITPRSARRRLQRAGLGRLFTKRWQDPRTGRRFRRRAWGITLEEYLLLLVEDAKFETRVLGRRFTGLGVDPGPPLRGAERQAIWRLLNRGQPRDATKFR